ncbi:metal-dependent hydrolase family protein [Ruegeria profundi]|uniref:metal-dependent hydrolase family protein n=1 Tax=Ruegeria profundi TaxID=1685378 RepID=UPI001CD36764|nr:amidohydrolase family protein [Ruegeria profundi]MCA0930687.1 amidohydrolase family protein [Ruegeria profundi]
MNFSSEPRFKRTLSKSVVSILFVGILSNSAFVQEDRFPILITNVHVFNGVDEQRIENANVLVVDNLIADVSAEPLAVANAQIIDGGGRTLMPGLIDAHVHMTVTEPVADLRDNFDWMYWGAVSTIEAEKMLLRGFTTVRDAGGPAIGLQKAIDRGKAVGPRIYASGPVISQTSGHGEHRVYTEPHPNFMGAQPSLFNQHLEFLADGVPETLRATREAPRLGAVQIKVMAGGGVSSQVDPLHTVQGLPEELEASVRAAADWGTYVMVHAFTDESIVRSIEAGVISIEHGQLMTEVGAQAIKDADAWIVPFYSLLGIDEQTIVTALGPWSAEKFLSVQAGARNQMQLIKDFGIENVAFSTDIIGDPVALTKQNDEFKYRLEAWTSHEILQQATSKSAALLALSGKLNPYTEGPLGVIEQGANVHPPFV